ALLPFAETSGLEHRRFDAFKLESASETSTASHHVPSSLLLGNLPPVFRRGPLPPPSSRRDIRYRHARNYHRCDYPPPLRRSLCGRVFLRRPTQESAQATNFLPACTAHAGRGPDARAPGVAGPVQRRRRRPRQRLPLCTKRGRLRAELRAEHERVPAEHGLQREPVSARRALHR
ncbi:hypothetical protein C8R44DRAFT_974567, partial [Mycena epipterygia]